jgi:hypothetical protein
MHPQIEALIVESVSAGERLHRLVDGAQEATLKRRPTGGGWSAAECIAHLNLTGEAYFPLVEAALTEARALGEPAPDRYRRDLLGWLLWRMSRPGNRTRVRTSPAFVPGGDHPLPSLIGDFDRSMGRQVQLMREADGLPLQKVKVRSPFDARLRYSLYSVLTILPVHQHRHLLQAERAVANGGG